MVVLGYVSSCAELKEQMSVTTDGEYNLYIIGTFLKVWSRSIIKINTVYPCCNSHCYSADAVMTLEVLDPDFVLTSGANFSVNLVPRNSRQPLILMMTPICPRFLNMINDFVLLRFRARAPEDLSAIEVIYFLFYFI